MDWSPAVREAIEDLIWASRILVCEGVLDAFGHVSVRHPEDPGAFLQTTQAAPLVGEARDVLVIRHDGTVVTPAERRPYAERILHGATYEARPDVHAVCHHHAEALIPFTVTDVPLRPLTHMGSPFWQGATVYDAYDISDGMLVRSQREGRRIVRALGDRRCLLMRGHGAVVVGEDLRRLVLGCVYQVRDAREQLEAVKLAQAFGKQVRYLSEEEARAASETILGPRGVVRAWEHFQQSVPGELRPRFPW